jgi:hypothetical protein
MRVSASSILALAEVLVQLSAKLRPDLGMAVPPLLPDRFAKSAFGIARTWGRCARFGGGLRSYRWRRCSKAPMRGQDPGRR